MKPLSLPPSHLTTLTVFILGLSFFPSGCHHPPATPSGSGLSSFAFVEPPPTKPRKATLAEPTTEPLIQEHFVEAELMRPAVLPLYPAKALTAKAGLSTVGVRITIDVEGHVIDVAPSLLTFSTPGPYAEEFYDAVRAAVTQWRFVPAQRYSLRIYRSSEGGGPPKELHREKTETYFDLSFTFTAAGKVLSGE